VAKRRPIRGYGASQPGGCQSDGEPNLTRWLSGLGCRAIGSALSGLGGLRFVLPNNAMGTEKKRRGSFNCHVNDVK
jgi:hypothetical protein